METSNCDNVSDCDSKVSFWRKNTKVVPGRPSPKKENHMSNPLTRISGSSSFNEFQASVNDAWDMGDDEFCIISGETERKLCKKSSQSSSSIITKDASNLAVHSSNHTKTTIVNKPKEVTNDSKCISNVETVEDRGSSDPKPMTKRRSLGPECVSYPGRPHALGTGVLSARDTDCESKMDRFQILLSSALLDLGDLRELSWSGIPVKVRAITWKLLCDYLPTSLERREGVLKRKREEYWNFVKQYYDIERDEAYKDTYRQIHIDIPRMNPLITLFQQLIVQEMFERILFIWAIRHPASGYVQGINDLVTPFFVVFLQEVISAENIDSFDTSTLTQTQRDIIEADSFWCLSKFLDNIQDNYIFAQLGIQQKVNQLKELIKRINEPLHRHLVSHGVDYLQFSFRWMNNSLTRELPLHCVIRLWDTYLAESDGFATFQLYVCAAFLLHWKSQLLQEQDFQGLLLLLQNLPTQSWTNSHISLLVAEAYKLKFTFADAPNHLQSSKSVR